MITQEPNERYVQLAIGHGMVRVEASSNVYLTSDFQLSPGEEDRLRGVGFRVPTTQHDDDYDRPENWWFEEPAGLPVLIADLITHTLVSIMAFDSAYPVTITMFGADHPCVECSWGLAPSDQDQQRS